MELVVVMVILIALAGILLPLFPTLLTKAHTSTAATNMSELSKAVQLYYNSNLQLPYNLDNLGPLAGVANTSNAAVTSLIAAYPGGTTAAPDLYTGTLSAPTSTSTNQSNDYTQLVAAGLTNVLQTTANAGGSWTPTYNPYSATAVGSTFLPQNLATATPPGVSTPLAGLTVVYVSGAAAARELAQPVTGKYVLFGVGDYSSLSGKVLQEAPIHFDDSPAGQPTASYCRFGLVFKTTGDGSYADLPAAEFVGAVDLGDSSGITSIQDHVQEYLNSK
jgi:type II secretory pathway pseudopilin PulG